MKIVNLIQGTPEWHAHRAQHHNASDAPAMMGCSPYKTRAQLIREVATGIAQEVDAATQRRFDDGHRFEELARPLAEQIIGEELFPVTGTNGKLSASFDGLTMDGETAFEHKSLNDTLRAAMADGNDDLPLQYQVQMEQQLAVSDASRVLFMASKWAGDELVEERHCWYVSNAELRAKIGAGWEQFEADVAAYEPEIREAQLIGRTRPQLPALRVQATGMVTMSNLEEFRAASMAQFEAMNYELVTDQDFADAENDIKFCKSVEDNAKASKASILSGTADLDAILRAIDDVAAEARRVRLSKEGTVKARKDERRTEIGNAARRSVQDHVRGINETLGQHAIQVPPTLIADIGEAMKGKRSFASMQEAVDAVAANAKIEASQAADRIRANIAILDGHAEHATLFADRVQLCSSKAPEDLRNLAKARIAEHDQREADKLEAEREKIRAEEAAKLQQAQAPAPQPTPVEQPRANVPAAGTFAPAPSAEVAGQRIKLGDINAAISPLSITADGLALLGFKPAALERGAKLYDVGQLPGIYEALRSLIVDAENSYPEAA